MTKWEKQNPTHFWFSPEKKKKDKMVVSQEHKKSNAKKCMGSRCLFLGLLLRYGPVVPEKKIILRFRTKIKMLLRVPQNFHWMAALTLSQDKKNPWKVEAGSTIAMSEVPKWNRPFGKKTCFLPVHIYIFFFIERMSVPVPGQVLQDPASVGRVGNSCSTQIIFCDAAVEWTNATVALWKQ